MKKIITIIIFLLSGCATQQVPLEVHVVKQTEYVIRIPPKELLTLPEQVPEINVDTSQQSDVAAWTLAKEKYTRNLEDMIKGIGAFFSDQQSQLDQSAKAQNIQYKEAGDKAQETSKENVSKKTVNLNVIPVK